MSIHSSSWWGGGEGRVGGWRGFGKSFCCEVAESTSFKSFKTFKILRRSETSVEWICDVDSNKIAKNIRKRSRVEEAESILSSPSKKLSNITLLLLLLLWCYVVIMIMMLNWWINCYYGLTKIWQYLKSNLVKVKRSWEFSQS